MIPEAFPDQDGIWVDVASQRLTLRREGQQWHWPVSTAAAGVGEQKGSYRTPRGHFRIRAAIGDQASADAVWVGRRYTGEQYTAELAARYPCRDWILGQILWLSGTQPGFNRYGNVDTRSRYIYIHGTPLSEPMGVPRSHGCIRMHGPDLLSLYSLVRPGESVWVGEDWSSPQSIADIQVSVCSWQGGYHFLRELRDAVFVNELGIPADVERDAEDPLGTHFLVWDRLGNAIGCGRLMPDGSLGRMAVLEAYRGAGVGQRLLQTMMSHARAAGYSSLKLYALCTALPFYLRVGAVPVGSEFLAAEIPHQEMRLPL